MMYFVVVNVDWAYVPAARSGPKGYVHMVCTKLSYKNRIAVLDLNVCTSTRILLGIQDLAQRAYLAVDRPHL